MNPIASLTRIRDAVRDERIDKWIEVLRSVRESDVPRIAAAIAELEPALAHISISRYTGPLAPSYPDAPKRIAAAIALGTSPAELSGLTAREAHEWLLAGGPNPAWWLLDRYSWRYDGVPCPRIPSVPVAKWLIARWQNPEQRASLLLERSQTFAGQHVDGKFIDRVDELRPSDLRTSVIDTFERAGRRLIRSIERLLRSRGEPLRSAPAWWRPAKCARLLLSGADLVAEGKVMRHCVAGYASVVKSGASIIVGICVLAKRSTVEIDPRSLEIRQHKGPSNDAPHDLCVRALATMHKKWLAAQSGIRTEGQ